MKRGVLRPTEAQLEDMVRRRKVVVRESANASAIAATVDGRWLTLPLPPSVNDYWRHPGFNLRDPRIAAMVAREAHHGGANAVMAWALREVRGHTLVSREGRRFKQLVWVEIRRLGVIRPLKGRIRAHIVLHCRNKSSDIDNRVKPLLDALQRAKAFENDNQVDEIYVVRAAVKRDGECRVRLEEIRPEPAITINIIHGPRPAEPIGADDLGKVA